MVQGSNEWHQSRKHYIGASEVAALFDCHPYITRHELMMQKLGLQETSPSNFIMERGKYAESLARKVAETLLGQELFPETIYKARIMASLDGITIDGRIIWEHKLWNKSYANGEIPEYVLWQCQQQLMVTGAGKVILHATEWNFDGDMAEPTNQITFNVFPDKEMQDKIVDAVADFFMDMQEYHTASNVVESRLALFAYASEKLEAAKKALDAAKLEYELAKSECEQLENDAIQEMLNRRITECEGFRLRKSESVAVEKTAVLPVEYVRQKTTVEPDKVKLKKALSNGEVIAGVQIITSHSLVKI